MEIIGSAQHWMSEQVRLGRQLYLVLDGDGQDEVRRALLDSRHGHQHFALYTDTPLADLADIGPAIFQLGTVAEPAIDSLLDTPETNWGWLASGEPNGLSGLVKHWSDRLIVGQRPHQAFYRFHDNRVVDRALKHLPADALPGYLGPVASLCYWQGAQWISQDNPAPGEHPVPTDPAWLNQPDNEQVLRDNLHRYLVAEHSEAFGLLVQTRDPDDWLSDQQLLARLWEWEAPEQLHLLITQSLYAPDHKLPANWQPNTGETPQTHFERLRDEARFWSTESLV